jgi:predicted dehydrogenase
VTQCALPLRHVVIGVGAGIFQRHRMALEAAATEFVGVSDVNEVVARERAEELGCPAFVDHRRMLSETAPDVAVVVTPHPFHAAVAIDSLEAGCHVLVEKPMAVKVSEADAMIEAADQAGRILAVNFQRRLNSAAQAARRIIQGGVLGEIQHVDVTAAWPRTQAYYGMSSWRGTWCGEGGGLLMNQAPHHLDLLCYLMGLPEALVAWTSTQLHDIETEDTVQAMMRWPQRALCSLHLSTGEAERPERIEVVGTRGYLLLNDKELQVEQFEVDFRDYVRESSQRTQGPDRTTLEVEVGDEKGDHEAIVRDFHEAIRKGRAVACDAREGRMSLELANAMIMSSQTGAEVSLPIDRNQYSLLLSRLQGKEST